MRRSRFVAFFGVVTVLDPILILIVDLISGNYNCANVRRCCCSSARSALCVCVGDGGFRRTPRALMRRRARASAVRGTRSRCSSASALTWAPPPPVHARAPAQLLTACVMQEGSGITGAFLTVFIYLALMLVAAFVLYIFLLHVHLDARMLDT